LYRAIPLKKIGKKIEKIFSQKDKGGRDAEEKFQTFEKKGENLNIFCGRYSCPEWGNTLRLNTSIDWLIDRQRKSLKAVFEVNFQNLVEIFFKEFFCKISNENEDYSKFFFKNSSVSS
jgi:hypothetical protein